MSRSSIVSIGTLTLCCATVSGQQQVQALRVTMPIKDAGIYHLATGTWTRGSGSTANLGPDVIFRSDAPSGYFAVGWEGSEGVDEAILPSTSNLNVAGLQDTYRINGFQFAYCSSGGGVAWRFKFYESYTPCDDPDQPANCINANATFCLQGLPGMGCWTVTIDLMGGFEFSLEADGGACAPGYQGKETDLDHGGWGATWFSTGGGGVGPILAGGDVKWAPEGDGTCYQPGLTCAAGASGLGARDLFGIGTPFNGCYSFGGYNNTNGCGGPSQNPAADFAMVYFADCTVPGEPCPDAIICDDDALNVNHLVIDACDCSVGSINIALIDCHGSFEGRTAYLLIGQGSTVLTDPPGAVGGLCLGGAIIGRYSQDAGAITGGVHNTDVLNALSGGGGGGIPTIGGNLCTPSGQTWRFQAWHRDIPGNPSRFSQGLEVTFK